MRRIMMAAVLAMMACGGPSDECSPKLSRKCVGSEVWLCVAYQQADGSPAPSRWVNDGYTRHLGLTGDCADHGMVCVPEAATGATCAPAL